MNCSFPNMEGAIRFYQLHSLTFKSHFQLLLMQSSDYGRFLSFFFFENSASSLCAHCSCPFILPMCGAAFELFKSARAHSIIAASHQQLEKGWLLKSVINGMLQHKFVERLLDIFFQQHQKVFTINGIIMDLNSVELNFIHIAL